jgi:hypothetical protein
MHILQICSAVFFAHVYARFTTAYLDTLTNANENTDLLYMSFYLNFAFGAIYGIGFQAYMEEDDRKKKEEKEEEEEAKTSIGDLFLKVRCYSPTLGRDVVMIVPTRKCLRLYPRKKDMLVWLPKSKLHELKSYAFDILVKLIRDDMQNHLLYVVINAIENRADWVLATDPYKNDEKKEKMTTIDESPPPSYVDKEDEWTKEKEDEVVANDVD